MREEVDTKQQVHVHYVNTGVPCTVEENFSGYYYEHGELPLEDFLQDQEIVHQSLLTNSVNGKLSSSENAHSSPDNEEGTRDRKNVEDEENTSRSLRDAQLEMDEALARVLQEMEDQLTVTPSPESAESEEAESSSAASPTVNEEPSSTDAAAVADRQDNVDPDNMTYEELQSLGETIGIESRGLSDELISYLRPFKYKTGFFSRKDKNEDCVICLMVYKNGDRLISLPCQHQYHSNCITRWLKTNKACPICNEEVFG